MDARSDTSDSLSMDHYSASSPDTTRMIDVCAPLSVDCTDTDDDEHSSITSGGGKMPSTGTGSRRDRKRSQLSPIAQETLRLKINHRERERMHDLNSSMDALRQVMPYAHGPSVKKLSKMATLLLARNYIILLTRSLEEMRRLLADAYRNPLVAGAGGVHPVPHPGTAGFRGLEKTLTAAGLPPLGPLHPPPPGMVGAPTQPATPAFHLPAHLHPHLHQPHHDLLAPRVPRPDVPSSMVPPTSVTSSTSTSTTSVPTSAPAHIVHHPTPTVAPSHPARAVSSPAAGLPISSAGPHCRVDLPGPLPAHHHPHPLPHHPFPPPHFPHHHPHLAWAGAPCSCVYCHLAAKSSESLLKQA